MRGGVVNRYDDGNIFAKIIRNEMPCHKVFETDSVIAFLDAFPCTAGHALLIPKTPYTCVVGDS